MYEVGAETQNDGRFKEQWTVMARYIMWTGSGPRGEDGWKGNEMGGLRLADRFRDGWPDEHD